MPLHGAASQQAVGHGPQRGVCGADVGLFRNCDPDMQRAARHRATGRREAQVRRLCAHYPEYWVYEDVSTVNRPSLSICLSSHGQRRQQRISWIWNKWCPRLALKSPRLADDQQRVPWQHQPRPCHQATEAAAGLPSAALVRAGSHQWHGLCRAQNAQGVMDWGRSVKERFTLPRPHGPFLTGHTGNGGGSPTRPMPRSSGGSVRGALP